MKDEVPLSLSAASTGVTVRKKLRDLLGFAFTLRLTYFCLSSPVKVK